ncbi:MAG: FecR domain-containing protein [Elusimicrobia bacterium]|nr:FecR domain-containing protein [Elusimicrobiota bacterium]
MRMRFTMFGLLAIASIVIPRPTVAADAAASRKSFKEDPLAWVAGEREEARRGVAEQRERVAASKRAISKAEGALRLSREYKDAEAEPIAQQALETGQKSLALAERHLKEQQRREETLGEIITGNARGLESAMALPLNMRGDVRLGVGANSVPLDPTHVVLPGEDITTGAKGQVTLTLLNGEAITLGPNTSFSFTKVRKGPIEQFLYELKNGRGRVLSKGAYAPGAVRGSIHDERRYRAVAAVAAVRGTDFLMTAGADGIGRFSLYDGRIELGADEADKVRDSLKPWWLTEGVPAYAAPAAEKVSRIAALRGAASIVNKEKGARPAKAGDSLIAGERLETGEGSLAHLDLVRGQRVVIGEAARFTGMADSKGAPMYGVGRGRAHVWGAGNKEPSQFLTPNTVAESRAREFEVRVDADGAAEYTPVVGSLDISATGDKLDWSKIDAWLDE